MKNTHKIFLTLLCISVLSSCSKEDRDSLEIEQIDERIFLPTCTLRVVIQARTSVSQKQNFDPNAYLVDIEAAHEDYDEHHDYGHAVKTGIAASQNYGESVVAPSGGFGGNPIGTVVNPNNSLDYVGRFHAEILEATFYQDHQIIYPNGTFSYTNSINYTDNYTNSSTSGSLSQNDFDTFYQSVVAKIVANNYLLSQVMQQNLNEGKLTQDEGQILITYFQAQESASSLNNYIQYSIQVEDMVVNSSLPTTSKNLLLFTMATARHDINFWNPY